MARTYVFEEARPANTVVLSPKAGSLVFPCCAQLDCYEFGGDGHVKLHIADWWFDSESLDDLIAFLQAAKNNLTKKE